MVCISSAGGNPVTDPLPQPVHDDTKPVILALNNAHAAELSWLEAAQLEALLQEAFYARQIGDGAAFLLAFDQAASYQSPNFRWFCQRYRRFVYIDRVVVAPLLRGRGYARTLYTDLFARAGRIGHTLGVCEVNSDPPNPASDAFHATMGFAEVGYAVIHHGSKSVRYLARPL
jgi:predicted GNAT superfamily acetyltransferase